MKSLELLSLGLRIVGIYAFVLVMQTGLLNYRNFFSWSDGEEGMGGVVFITYMLLSVMAALCVPLVFLPVTVAGWLLPKTPEGDPLIKGDIAQLQTTAFTVLGVYFIADALPDLAGTLMRYILVSSQEYPDVALIDGLPIWMASLAMQLVIGAVLCLMPARLSDLLAAVRGAGLRK